MPIASTLAHALPQPQFRRPLAAMLQLPEFVYRQLRRHGEETYPHECCGVLLGTVFETVQSVLRAIPVENASTGNTRNHYQIDPVQLIRILRDARTAGLDVLGFYHSHPDHPAMWSATDLEEAHWLSCSYVITQVIDGAATVTRSFHLAGHSEEDKRLEPEEIRLLASADESRV
jgi:proteasome lid subunit RPN8/RPN11